MSYIKVFVSALLLTGAFTSAPAFAGAQEDVANCRAAMDRQSNIDMSDYRLRFKKQKGFRARTILLMAIPHKKAYGKSFEFTCTLNRNEVTALNTDHVVFYAKK